ncbi:MAG: alanine dehydrogenase [Syntrophobacteraceae bacterium]|nr:alanine dehydrogenase [Syntrophobacteraceae bacterium]
MKIGCPKEIKNNEYRAGIIPGSVRAYRQAGHEVYVQKGAGVGAGILDAEYEDSGAKMVDTAEEVWNIAEMIVKVKEPMPGEYGLMKSGQVIYAYFHFAADEQLTRACLEREIIALAYETVQEANGSLPLLKPMSEVAGRMAPIMGAYYMARIHGGRGMLPTGVPGVAPAHVLILGGGTVGSNAARVSAGLGAWVTILDINLDTLENLGNIMPLNVSPIYADSYTIERGLREADMVIGAVLIPGARAPKLITRAHLGMMKPGCVFVDVAIDQGGCAETSRPTTHDDPVYLVDNIIHYCVANMPGAYARSSTFALNNRTVKYGLKIAGMSVEKACRRNMALRKGLNLYRGTITFKPVAEAFGLEALYRPADEVLP